MNGLRKPKVSDERIRQEFADFFERTGRSPSMAEKPWQFSLKADRIAKRFGGSWNKALTMLGLPPNETKYVPDHIILGELYDYYVTYGVKPSQTLRPWPFSLFYTRIAERFGSWNDALRAAGVPVDKRSAAKAMSQDEMLDALRLAATHLARTPEYRDCPTLGIPTAETYKKRFGSWNTALELAGLGAVRKAYTDDALCVILRQTAEELGRTPKMMDFQTGQPAYATFYKHFGSWNKALVTAGFPVNLPQNLTPQELLDDLTAVARFMERTPTYREYDRFGQYTVRTITRVIGATYPGVLRMIGLKPITRGELAQMVIRMTAKFIEDEPVLEKTFDWLRNDKTGKLLRLDAYFPKHHFAIEFHGEQHHRPVAEWGGSEGMKAQQYRDELKRKLCAENGLPLLTIQYDNDLSPAGIRELVTEFVREKC